jgi:hypothetical protein
MAENGQYIEIRFHQAAWATRRPDLNENEISFPMAVIFFSSLPVIPDFLENREVTKFYVLNWVWVVEHQFQK